MNENNSRMAIKVSNVSIDHEKFACPNRVIEKKKEKPIGKYFCSFFLRYNIPHLEGTEGLELNLEDEKKKRKGSDLKIWGVIITIALLGIESCEAH